MTPQVRMLAATIATGVALFAALWVLAIAPARSDRDQVDASVLAQEARLAAAKTNLTTYSASRKQFSGLLTELRRLDKAVPARGDIAAMLRELQRRAKVRNSDLRLVALKDPGAAGAGPTPSTPGAITGPGGLSALPFTFEYTGRYFDLLDILRTVRRSVRVTSGDLAVDGRLLTIDGLAFNRADADTQLTKAVLNATAYIAPDGEAAAQPPDATVTPAPATTATKGGS